MQISLRLSGGHGSHTSLGALWNLTHKGKQLPCCNAPQWKNAVLYWTDLKRSVSGQFNKPKPDILISRIIKCFVSIKNGNKFWISFPGKILKCQPFVPICNDNKCWNVPQDGSFKFYSTLVITSMYGFFTQILRDQNCSEILLFIGNRSHSSNSQGKVSAIYSVLIRLGINGIKEHSQFAPGYPYYIQAWNF